MGEVALQPQRGSDPWKPVLVILILVLITLMGSIVYKEYFQDRTFFNESSITTEVTETITIEDRMSSWDREVMANEVMEIYLALPREVMLGILTRIGSTATPKEIVENYNKNKEYWISTQLSTNLQLTPSGPDADNIEKVEITTTLKEPQVKKISPIAGDSIK